uniref:Uncharacterized protein n=1 Tax=Rhizophora mucronata TaxID=61149 RepID=A0A2P2MTW5_RHIMU
MSNQGTNHLKNTHGLSFTNASRRTIDTPPPPKKSIQFQFSQRSIQIRQSEKSLN